MARDINSRCHYSYRLCNVSLYLFFWYKLLRDICMIINFAVQIVKLAGVIFDSLTVKMAQ